MGDDIQGRFGIAATVTEEAAAAALVEATKIADVVRLMNLCPTALV